MSKQPATRATRTTFTSTTCDCVRLYGLLAGKDTELFFEVHGACVGILKGRKLYRLAKAIVKHMEADK